MANIITYDTIIVQQGQCLLDIALQHYGTADPQALIALMQDNNLDNATIELQPGMILKIRRYAKFNNQKIIDYYRINSIIPANNVTLSVQTLIETVYYYGGSWSASVDTLCWIGDYGFTQIQITTKYVIEQDTPCTLYIRSNKQLNGYILFGDTGRGYTIYPDTDYNISLLSGIAVHDNIWLYFGYLYPGETYELKLILNTQ